MEYAKTLKNDNNQAVAFAVRKRHNLTIDEKFDLIMQEIKGIKDRLDNIDDRLDNIVKKNNLVE